MSKDPVTRYATDVLDGKIVAGRLVKQACVRHLDDVAHAAERGLIWRADKAQRVINFFPDVLCLPENTDADESKVESEADVAGPGQTFVLAPFQQFIAGSLFGWYTTSGFRRFRTAYIETAKGSGKTPFGAGLMLYMLTADGERGAQVYAAATGRDQAKLAFTDAERMVNASPALLERLDHKVNNLAVLETGSFFRPISSEKRGLDGKRVHGALIDELHEHPSPIVVNKMRKGTKGRRNALIVEITNSGFDRGSVCWNHHDYSRQVLAGSTLNDGWFAFVCGLDPCDACLASGRQFPADDCPHCDDWKVEGPHWLKANPNLGVSLSWQYLRDLVHQAKGMPSEVSDLLRFNFCVWTQAQSRAIDLGRWALCGQLAVNDADLVDVPCYGGLDLGLNDDLSAFAKIWVLEDGRVVLRARFWTPEASLTRFPNRPYEEWRRAGILEVTEGDATDYGVVQDAIEKDCTDFAVRSVSYDPRFASQMAQYLMGQGIDVVKKPQGFPLSEATHRFLALIADGELVHGNNPILNAQAGNFVVRHGKPGEIRPDKDSSPEKIDGIVAAIMAIDEGLIRNQQTGKSVYDEDEAEIFTV